LAPFEICGLATPGGTYGVAVANGLVYVADRESGLRIIDLGPEYLPEPQTWMRLASGAAMLRLLDRRRRSPRG